MKIGYILSALLFVAMPSHALKIDAHIWVGQQVINDLTPDGKLSFNIDGKIVEIAPPNDVVNAILGNPSAFLMGNIGPDAAPDVVVGQSIIHPGLKDENGNNIGWQTDKWLEHLLNNQDINSVGKAYTYGFLGHASADVFAHTYVNQYAGDTFDLFDESLVEQRHFVLEGYISKHLPPLTNSSGLNIGEPWQQISLDDTYAEFIRDVLVYDTSVQNEYNKSDYTRHLTGYYQFRQELQAIAEQDIWLEIDTEVLRIVAGYYGIALTSNDAESLVNELQRNLDRLNRVSEDVQALDNQIYNNIRRLDESISTTVDNVQNAEEEFISKHREWRDKLIELPSLLKNVRSCKWYKPRYVECKIEREIEKVFNQTLLTLVNTLETEAFNLKNNLIDNTQQLHAEVNTAVDSLKQIENAITDLGQLLTSNTSPIKAVLDGWVSDVDLAMSAYVKASGQSMLNTINNNPDEGAMDPLIEWFGCYHQSIVGIPSSISGCEGVISGTQQLIHSLGNIISAAEKLGLPDVAVITELKSRIEEELITKLQHEVTEQVIDMLPQEVQDLLALLEIDIDDNVLNYYFNLSETTGSPKGLIKFPNMAQRVKAEMYLTENNKLDPDKFAPIHNAIVMAKLALLDKSAIDTLAAEAGSTDYVNYTYLIDNLVSSAFSNIDGNHQWLPLPPPIPNTFNYYPTVDYTYSTDRSELGDHSGGTGFVFWQGDMRSKLFLKLFIGPVEKGLLAPETLNLPKVELPNYPYKPCAANTFPQSVEDNLCTVVNILPAILLLLN